ncbi:hypothetical protein MKX01_023113 [Papaver californicum]|nr:hypothetical protein MKX01_023113 [Papaver californicum]
MNACAELPNSCYGRMIHGCIAKTRWISEVEVNNSILSFYAKLGCCENAVKIFESIESHTQVSWNAMINAHMKVGDVHEALAVFHQAPEKNLVSWTITITGYARSGYVEKALIFLVDMTRNLIFFGLGVPLGEDLRSLEPEREIGYVLSSNMYCANGKWKEAEKIRKIMLERGVKKSPGCSWIEMKNEVMVFDAGNEYKNPEMNEMYKMLRVLESDM